MLQQYSPAVGNGLKTAWKLLVAKLGGVEAVASCTRATKSMASEYGGLHADRWVPVDVLLDAETIAGMPLVTAALARAQGYDLVPVVPHGEGDVHMHLARIGETAAELFRDAAIALADGVLDEAERVGLAARMAAARVALSHGEDVLLRRAGSGPVRDRT